MFQNLRTNSTLYMLHKGASPVLECARVIEVKNLRTVYKNGPTVLYPQPVEVVDIIAQSGNSGLSLAPHLHYEIKHNGMRVDPIHYFFMELDYEDYQKIIRIAQTGMQSFD